MSHAPAPLARTAPSPRPPRADRASARPPRVHGGFPQRPRVVNAWPERGILRELKRGPATMRDLAYRLRMKHNKLKAALERVNARHLDGLWHYPRPHAATTAGQVS